MTPVGAAGGSVGAAGGLVGAGASVGAGLVAAGAVVAVGGATVEAGGGTGVSVDEGTGDVGGADTVGDTETGVACSPHATNKADTTRVNTIAKP